MSENNQTKSNGRGGRRAGAGRKMGSATTRTREIANNAANEGITPLEFMLNIMRTEDPVPEAGKEIDYRVAQMRLEMRFEAAKAAAPYIHPKLAAIEHSGPDGGPIQQESALSGLSDGELATVKQLLSKAKGMMEADAP